MVMSAQQYIAAGDIEGAYSRYLATSKRWKNHWWECVENIWNSSKAFIKKYILDSVTHTLTKIQTSENFFSSVDIHYIPPYTVEWDKATRGQQKVYLFKFYDPNGIVFSKIGTTTRTCLQRLKEEIKYYQKRGFNLSKVDLVKVLLTTEQAEAFESFCRAVLIKEFPGTWRKNDRFFGVDIPATEVEKLWANFHNI